MRSTTLVLLAILCSQHAMGQCPTLGQNATFTSADCLPGSNPCALCPGDQYILTPTGTNLQAGDCINWYINDMPNFNPYNGEGTFIGCSELTTPPPDPCNPNPIFLGIFVNACGTEENNEFLGIWSGGGFNLGDLSVTYTDAANNGCGFQAPSGTLQASIEAECPGAVFVGSGDVVPANVVLVIFTSSDADFDYNFSGLCATNGTFYVTQQDCSHGTDVFPNTGSGTATTSVSIGCWSDDITYDLAQVANTNGAFVAELPILGTFYGQAGCSWPSFPGLPGGDPIVNVTPLEVTVGADQCNNGPYYIVGAYEPLPTGCPPTLTNYLTYDVVCPSPVLGTTDLCSNVTNYNLVQLQDPNVSAGTWSGDGVSGSTFNASGLSGPIELTFTPTSPCGTPATTIINVGSTPGASFDPVVPVCAGGNTTLVVNLTGNPSWTFDLLANGSLVNTFTATESPFEIVVNPIANTSYTLTNLVNDDGCAGPNASIFATVSNSSPSATISLVGNDSICAGSSTLVSVDFSGGTAPYDFTYAINGVPQTQQLNVPTDPFVFPVTINNNANITLVNVTDDNGCTGNVMGSAFVRVLPSPTAQLASDTVTICSGASDTIVVKLSGIAPFNFIYRVNGVNQPAIATSDTTFKIAINPTVNPTVYTLFSVNDSICTGTVSGIYQVNVTPVATAFLSGMDTICAGDMAQLAIDFNGTGPFIVDYTANGIPQSTIQTNSNPHVISVSPTVNTSYVLTGFNANGCPGTFSGTATVAVPPVPTAVITGSEQICQGGSGTTITVTMTGIAPFTFTYTANNMNPMQVTTMSNVYTFMVNPVVGTAYRITAFNDAVCGGTFSGVAQVFVFVPASANMSGSAVFCDSADTNIMVDFNGSGPFTIEYTVNGVLQPPIFTSDDPLLIPISVNATTTYVLTKVESPGCTGIPAGSATITVNYPPSYSNLSLNCNPLLNNYTVSFTVLNATLPLTLESGSGTFTGNTFVSTPIPQGTGYSFVFHDANDCGDISISGPSTCNCSTAAGTMNLAPLSACLNDTITAVYNGGFVNDGDDQLLYVLHANPALPLGAIYGWSATPSFTFQPGMTPGTTYYISAIAGNPGAPGEVDLMDLCLSVSQGTPVVFRALPTADLGTITADVCAGDSIEIQVALTGSPVFSITPAFNGVAQSPITGINSSTYDLVVFPTQDVIITLQNVSDQFCAAGTATGSVAVSIVPPPSFGTPLISCDYVNSTYTVNFTVTGTPPFNLNGILATFNGSSFTSLPIPFGTPYLGYLTDGNNCGQDTLAGLGVCSCLSDAGVMSQNLVQACPGDTLFLPATVGAVVAPGDTLMYVMHTNATAPLGSILAWSYTPSFVFSGSMMSNVTYFVSAMVGNPNGMDEIDQTDPCLSVASSTPVSWFPAPTAMFPDTTIHLCPGQGFNLLVTLSGTPPYTLTYLENGVVKTGTPMQNFFVIGAQGLQETKIITLTAITDANGCTGTVSGTAQVFVHPPPVVTNVTPTCNFNDQTYTLEFDVLNADSSSVMVANLGGTFDPLTRHFVSDPMPVNQPYSFTVTDAWGCGSVTLSDTVDCTCVVNAGSLNGGSLVLCPGQDATILPAMGANLEPGDTLVYLLVSTPAPTAWTVLATSATPVFSFNPTTMMYGTTYYIVAVAGNISGGTIDYSDPCLSSAVGPTVLWRLPITATISGMDTICVGGAGMVQIDFTGDGPFFVTYTDGGVNQVLTNITQNPYALSVTPGATSSYSLVGVSGAGNCLGTADGTATVQVNTPPQAVNVVATCDFTTETYVLTFDISNGSVPNSTYSISGLAGSLVDTTFTSLPMPGAQGYSLVISDDAGCSTTLSGQPNCVCASMAGTLSNVQDACLPNGLVSGTSNGNSSLDPDDVVRYILCADPALLPMGIFAESATPQFGFQPGMTAGVTYYIVVAVGNQTNGMFDFNDPCRAFSAGFPVVFHNRPSATITGSANVCPGGNATFTVQFMGTPPFQLTYAINGVAQTPVTSPVNTFSILTNNVQFDQTFTLVSLQDAHCTGDLTGQATVTLSPEPTGSIAGGTTICVGDSTTLTLSLSGANTFNVTVSPGFTTFNGVSDGFTFQVAPTTTTTYSITNLVATGNICPPDLSGSAVVATDQVTASAVVSDFNGFNVSCPNGVDGSIALTPQTGNVPVTAVWNDGGNGLFRADLPAGIYQVTLTNQIGCTFTQVFDIQSPPELGISFDATGPTCFGDETGVISLNAINGGAGPFNLLVDDTAFGLVGVLPLILDNLSSGDYVLGIEDANGCISDDTVTVPEPVALMVNLGADTTISFGDSLFLLPIHNAPQVDTFYWTPPTYLSTPFDLETWSRPLNSQRYTLYLRDENGCEATDEILVRVQKDQRVFIPNIIYPQSTTFNDIATVWGGAEVANVQYMRIYDRWGELVFERDNFAHSDPSQGWNGTFKGEYVNPAVFVYVVEVLYINGETEIFKGDITVIR